MIELIYKLLVCHFMGDYVLQTDFIARSKGDNLWHMITHCFLYSLPFAFVFGIDERLYVLIAAHFAIDSFKARWHKLSYWADQYLHILFLALFYLIP